MRRPTLTKPLLVGEANPYSSRPEHALAPWPPGSAGFRLCKLLRLGFDDYMARFDRVNLFSVPPPTWSAGGTRAGSRYAAAVLYAYPETLDVILLGNRVARAFGIGGLEVWGSKVVDRVRVRTRFIRVPHPSGRCRAWNDPRSARRLRRLLKEFLP